MYFEIKFNVTICMEMNFMACHFISLLTVNLELLSYVDFLT